MGIKKTNCCRYRIETVQDREKRIVYSNKSVAFLPLKTLMKYWREI